jgi:hypothetical protein
VKIAILEIHSNLIPNAFYKINNALLVNYNIAMDYSNIGNVYYKQVKGKKTLKQIEMASMYNENRRKTKGAEGKNCSKKLKETYVE